MRVLLCGGGTAGHVNPALAIAQTIENNSQNSVFAYVVTKNGIENRLVNYPKYEISARGFQRKKIYRNWNFPFFLLESIFQSKKIIEEFRPDLVIGTGGYACFSVIFTAHQKKIKTILHESNALPGKAVLNLEKYADKIFVNFEESKKYFKNPQKIVYTGNPVKADLQKQNQMQNRERLGLINKKVLVCFGGSLGAERINDGMTYFVEHYLKSEENTVLFWATGKNDYARIVGQLKKKNLHGLSNLSVEEYIYDMAQKLSVADLVIARAGAMTISELSFLKKPSILIPSPNVANQHQYKNAKTLFDVGACQMITEDEINLLCDTIIELLADGEKRKELAKNVSRFSNPFANQKIWEEIQKTMKNGKDS